MSSDDDANSLCCPITLELFRDPVKADDGHVYERQSITNWLTKHGTSPLTRQVSSVSNLQSDVNKRKRADQRRKLSDKHKRQSKTVPLNPVPPPPPRNNNNNVNLISVRMRQQSQLTYRRKRKTILNVINGCCDFISETCEKSFKSLFSQDF